MILKKEEEEKEGEREREGKRQVMMGQLELCSGDTGKSAGNEGES